MKFLSIITLFLFINFTALPGVAELIGWDLGKTNVIMSEEETHSTVFQIHEKTIPKTLNVHDFIKFFETDTHNREFIANNDKDFISPHFSIISPPPEA